MNPGTLQRFGKAPTLLLSRQESSGTLTRHMVRGIFAAIILGGALSACSGASVVVPSEFPVPLVRNYPIDVGWYLDEALLGYEHAETAEGSGDVLISLGDAQRPMFEQLSRGLFSSHTFTEGPSGAPPLKGIIQPAIDELQFSTPKQTRSDYFEVWVRYKFKLYDPDGTFRGEWPLTAYGKAHTQNYGMNSTGPALQAAARAACRDAIAYFSLHFDKTPVVNKWLNEVLPGGVQ